jgi:RNA polymerase sigma factor (sigma-70 family)
MTGDTKVLEFNQFFVGNYKHLLGFVNLFRKEEYAEDILHDVFIKCYKAISFSGYSGNSYLSYTKRAIGNTRTNHFRNAKNSVDLLSPVDYLPAEFNDTYESEAELKLLQQQQDELLEVDRQNDVNFKHTMAFEYVDKYFSEKDRMVFKTYYVLKHKHLNYKQLSIATSMSQSTVSNIIKNIKKELRINLECYISTNMNLMELTEKVQKVEALLQKDLRHNLGEYKAWYLQVFGKSWSGCGCNLNQIRESLKAWHAKNRAILAEQSKIIQ